MMRLERLLICLVVSHGFCTGVGLAAETDPKMAALAREVRGKGWIAYGARSAKGDWDLFLCRPDGFLPQSSQPGSAGFPSPL